MSTPNLKMTRFEANSHFWINTGSKSLTLQNDRDKLVHFCSSLEDLTGPNARLFLYQYKGSLKLPIPGGDTAHLFQMAPRMFYTSAEEHHKAQYEFLWVPEQFLCHLVEAPIAKAGGKYTVLQDMPAYSNNLSCTMRMVIQAQTEVVCRNAPACSRGNTIFSQPDSASFFTDKAQALYPYGPGIINPYFLQPIQA